MHIHLDLVGGLSGDMFISGMLDVFPELADGLNDIIKTAGFENLVSLSLGTKNDGILVGSHFRVEAAADAEGHHHRHYSEIRRIINESALDADTRDTAIGIFHIIAEAEAAIHDKSIEDVAFHEVGAWDSIADVLCAAHLITACGAASFSVSSLPLGRGQVKTAHGMLPIPAPATALILKGYQFHDDEREGERITPTGAGIIRYLTDPGGTTKSEGELVKTGIGFGTRQFPGLSNVVRMMVFETNDNEHPTWSEDQVTALEFELDDQTPEDLAFAVDVIRANPSVIDVVQYGVQGKKGRHAISIRVLTTPADEATVIALCFDQTTTLGIRRSQHARSILHRAAGEVAHDGTSYRVKFAERTGRETVKVEMDDLGVGTHVEREHLRRTVESQAFATERPNGVADDQTSVTPTRKMTT